MASTARLLRLPSILDRYVVAEILPPSGLGLILFTFVLLLNHITQLTGVLISRGADLPTIVRIFLNLMPSILAITIPMAFLLGVLLAFGRLASDSEIVALRASGVSALELLRPVILVSLLTSGLTFYVMAVSVPRSNQAFREIVYSLMVNSRELGQALQNLLENAWRYTPPGGKVQISVEQTRRTVKVIFANTGGEIDAK